MNKKIILSLASALLVTYSLFASDVTPPMQKSQCPQKNCMQQKSCPQPQNPNAMMGKKHHTSKSHFISAVKHLNLSDEQNSKIKDIMRQNMKNMPKPYSAFSEDGFDKAMFIKLSKEREDSKLQKRADMMEAVYNVLDTAQKKELKDILQKRACMSKKSK